MSVVLLNGAAQWSISIGAPEELKWENRRKDAKMSHILTHNTLVQDRFDNKNYLNPTDNGGLMAFEFAEEDQRGSIKWILLFETAHRQTECISTFSWAEKFEYIKNLY